MTATRYLRIVLAAGLGAAAVVALVWGLFVLEPGLNDSWPLRFAPWLIGGALLLGALVAGCLAYARAAPATVERAPRTLLVLTAVGALLILLVAIFRALSHLE